MPIKLKKLSVAIISSLILFGCATGPQPPSPLFTPQAALPRHPSFTPFTHPQTIQHIVGPYETLYRISKTYDVDIATLMRVNNISDPKQLQKGQTLTIPATMGPRPDIPYFPTRRWTHIVIHHTATHEGNAFSIDQIHHDRGFWNGLGYHFLINNGTGKTQPGQIQVGPRWMKQQNGAHANANHMNENGIGIALVGNFSESRIDDEQMAALVFLVKTLQNYYDIPISNVIRHGDVPGKNTECPGLNFPWQSFKANL